MTGLGPCCYVNNRQIKPARQNLLSQKKGKEREKEKGESN